MPSAARLVPCKDSKENGRSANRYQLKPCHDIKRSWLIETFESYVQFFMAGFAEKPEITWRKRSQFQPFKSISMPSFGASLISPSGLRCDEREPKTRARMHEMKYQFKIFLVGRELLELCSLRCDSWGRAGIGCKISKMWECQACLIRIRQSTDCRAVSAYLSSYLITVAADKIFADEVEGEEISYIRWTEKFTVHSRLYFRKL